MKKSSREESGTAQTLQLFEKQMDDKKLDLEVLSWSDYVWINLYLMLYKNEDLIRKAWDLLVRFHSQRQSFFTLLKSVQMLEDDDAIEILEILDEKLNELREMAQNSEFWLGQSDRESIKTAKKTIDILNYWSNLMIEKEGLDDFEDSGDFDMNQDVPFLDVKPSTKNKMNANKSNLELSKSLSKKYQGDSRVLDEELQTFVNDKMDYERPILLDTETPNQEYQRMLRNLEAHEIIMLIIKQNSIKSTESEDLYKRVIKTAYSTLIRFVRNNKMNKKIMVKYVDTVFAEHHGTGLGSTQLEGEILKDDQSLLQKGYSDFKEKIEVINKHPLSSYLKASSMYYLTIYLKFKEEPIPENQIAVATELIDKENQNIIFLYEKDETRKELNTIVKSFVDSIQKQMSSNSLEIMVEIPPSLSYATQLLTVMAVATQGKNSITEIMCQSLFSVPALIKCFKEAKFAYTYKIALMQFFLDAYLDIEKDVPQELQDGIPEILDMLNDELMLCIKRTSDIGIYNYYIGKDVVENEIFKKGPSIYIISLLGRYRLSKLHEVFIYHNILTWLERIFQLRLIIDKRNEDSFLNIITSIQKLLEITKDKEDKKDVVYLIDVLKKNPQLRLILARINNEDEKEIEENDAKDLINSSMNRSNISSIHRHGDSKQRIESRMIEGSAFNAMNRTFLKNKDSVGLKLANMLNEIGEIQSFNDSMVNEFSEVIWHIKKIQYKSFLGFRGVCTLEPTDVIEALIDLTDLDGIQVTLEQIPIVIKILRRIIEIENKLTIKPAAEWSGDEDNPTPEIIRAQDLLTSCNACYLAANLVRNQKGDAVTNEAILMCIALLIGGNYNSQMKFWEDFVEDTDNRFLTLLSEILKSNFNKVMDHAIAYNEVCKRIQTLERSKDMEIKANEEENESEEMNELISIRDKLDARTQPDEDEDEDFTSIVYAKTLCIRILRFFQLLWENHNINLQDHLREQNDKDGVALGRNFDFPTYFSTMLGVFTKNWNIDIMDLGGQIIDTWIELIQGPCRGNQKALISAKIIDNSTVSVKNIETKSQKNWDKKSKKLRQKVKKMRLKVKNWD